MRTDAEYPPTIHEWFAAELDKSFAKLPTDQARYRHLILQENVWTKRYDEYGRFGRQPFCKPHPHYGRMRPVDFISVLGLISERRTALEKARPPALPLTEIIGSAAAMITAVGAWVAWYCVLCPPGALS
jgi:hypothetical protein